MFGWLFGKKGVDELKEDTKRGFESVKKDITSMSAWIKHLDSEKKLHEKDINEVKEALSTTKSLLSLLSLFLEVFFQNQGV